MGVGRSGDEMVSWDRGGEGVGSLGRRKIGRVGFGGRRGGDREEG